MIRSRLLCAALLTLAVALSHSQQTPSFVYTVDWAEAELIVTAKITLSTDGSLLPGERLKAEREITHQLPLYVREALFSIPIDSYWTIKTRALDDPTIMSAMESIWETGRKVKSFLNTNLTVLTTEYRFSLYPHVIAPFIEHTNGFPPEKRISHYPSEKFSGLVIFAKGEYPIHGARGNETVDAVQPSLLPRLYDQEMNLIFDVSCVEPELLIQHGMVIYTDSMEWRDFEQRVGPYPLFTMAREVFGDNRTDIVLPDEAVKRILALDHNISAICSGKILIIVDL